MSAPSDEWCEQQARICLAARMQPSEYKALTLAEIDAFVRVLNEQRAPAPDDDEPDGITGLDEMEKAET